jgi:putative peptide zinc metalloprotease protein
VKIPGLYTIERRKRINILISGICANVMLGILFLILSIITNNNIFFALAISNLQIAVINLVPFNLTDGYFILSNILKRTNLRKTYFVFIANLGHKQNKLNDKIEVTYIIVSIIYLFIFVFFELQIYTIAFMEDIPLGYSILAGLGLTVVLALIYIFVIKLRMRKQGGDSNEK